MDEMQTKVADLLASLKARAEDDVRASLAAAYSAGYNDGQASPNAPSAASAKIRALLEEVVSDLGDIDVDAEVEIDTANATECEIPSDGDDFSDVADFLQEHGGQTALYKEEIAIDASGLEEKLTEIRATLARVIRLLDEKQEE